MQDKITRFLKYLSRGTLMWLIVFVADYGIELFQIKETSVVTTLMGLKIDMLIAADRVETTFSLTGQALLIYVIFMAVWIVFSELRAQSKKKKERQTCSLSS